MFEAVSYTHLDVYKRQVEYLTFSADNPSSIRNCIEFARTNARAVRTALTVEMWEAINGAWLELKRFEATKQSTRYDREELSLIHI